MKIRYIFTIACCLILASLVFMTGCDKRNPAITKTTIPSSELLHIVDITASADTIYADNGITFSNISVLVKDQENIAASGVTVLFRANLGGIIRQVTTDSSGVASTTFYSRGYVQTGSALVEALIKSATTGGTIDSISTHVQIAPIPAVSNLTLDMNAHAFMVDQVMTIRSRATYQNGADVPDNTNLVFSATRGFFVAADGSDAGDSVMAKTSNGTASVQYNAGTLSGSGTVKVRIGSKTASQTVTINPGRPASLIMSSYLANYPSHPDPIVTDQSTINNPDSIFVRAMISDAHSNICPNVLVRFVTSLGTFANSNSTIYKNTDSRGYADVHFTPGLNSGSATINGYANSDTLNTQVLFTVTSNDLYSIQFENASQIDLNVAHTGGTESAILRVKLFDISGNLIDNPTRVHFALVGVPPEGANLNGADSTSNISNGGIAQVSVSSGTESGILSIRAWAYKADGVTVVIATKANIVIHAGSPSHITLSLGSFNSGANAGGGLWSIIAEAVVKDAYGNPVDYGTSVFFSLPDDQPNSGILTNCSITANSYVGNKNAVGDSTAGVAYTTLIYNGVYTYELVNIEASTRNLQGDLVTTSADLILPLNQPNVEAQIVPGHLDYFGLGAGLPDQFAIMRIALTDGQGNPIHHATLILSSNRGAFVYWAGTSLQWPNPGGPTDALYPNDHNQWNKVITDWYDPSWSYTGTDGTGHHYTIYDNNSDGSTNGIAEARIKYGAFEIPNGNPQDGSPGTVSSTATGLILGTNIAGQTTCILLKYPYLQNLPIEVTAPNGGDTWQMGTTHPITWTVGTTFTGSVKIELYKGTDTNPVQVITSSVTGSTGTYSWTIPTTLTPGSDYLMKITSTNTSNQVYDFSNGVFTITALPIPGL